MGSRRKSCSAASGTPMKQLTITESFTLSKSNKISNKNQRPCKITKMSGKNNKARYNMELPVLRQPSLVYIYISDSESENENDCQITPQAKPQTIMALNKPVKSAPQSLLASSISLNSIDVDPDGLNVSLNSVGSNSSDDTILYSPSPNKSSDKARIISDILIANQTVAKHNVVEDDSDPYDAPSEPNSPCRENENRMCTDRNTKRQSKENSFSSELERSGRKHFSEHEKESSGNKRNKTKILNTSNEHNSSNIVQQNPKKTTLSPSLSLKNANEIQNTKPTNNRLNTTDSQPPLNMSPTPNLSSNISSSTPVHVSLSKEKIESRTPGSLPIKRRLFDAGDNGTKAKESATTADRQAPSCSNSAPQILPQQIQKQITVVPDYEEPSCSHSTTHAPSPKNIQENDKRRPTPNSSPLKRKQTPSKSSPKKPKVAQSPIKNLKPKDGKRLQKNELDLLVKLIDTVCKNVHLKSLISLEELAILEKFVNSEDKYRYVIMKLFLWKKIWYNIFQLCNKGNIEIEDKQEITEIFDYLKANDLVLTDFKRHQDMTELLNNLSRVDVKLITKKLTRKEGKTKQENIGILVEFAATQATLSFTKTFRDIILDEIAKKMGDSIKIKPEVFEALSNAYLLATFANNEFDNIQDFFKGVIHSNVVFPRYKMEPYVLFYSRNKFLRYAQARKSFRELDELRRTKNKQGILELGRHAFEQIKSLEKEDEESDAFRDAPHLKQFTATHVYRRVLSMCACDELFTTEPETVKIWLNYLVNKFPNSSRIGKCIYTLIWIHMRYLKPADYETAANLLIDALKNKRAHLNEIDILELGKLAQKIVSIKRQRVDPGYHDELRRCMRNLPKVMSFPEDEFDAEYIETELKGKRNYKLRDSEGNVTINSVEKMALEYYRLGNYPEGSHSEGSMIKNLMVLLFWDIIYEPQKHIPGTFISQLQSAPLDMFTNHFYRNRADLINCRLDCIGSGWSEENLRRFAKDMYQKNAHRKAVYGEVMHTIENEDKIDELLDVIDRKILAEIFRRILSNVRAYSSGMPDLFVWNREEKTCKFVEVKGHGDKLSLKQELWLDYLGRKKANIAVCYVHSKGNKKTKKITRSMK